MKDVIEEVAEEIYQGWPLLTRLRFRYAMLRFLMSLVVEKYIRQRIRLEWRRN